MSNSTFYKGYKVSMILETDDKVIVGHVLEIDDIISFHGDSVAQFESKNLRRHKRLLGIVCSPA